MYDLNTLAPIEGGWKLDVAFDINTRGWIVAEGVLGSQTQGYLLISERQSLVPTAPALAVPVASARTPIETLPIETPAVSATPLKLVSAIDAAEVQAARILLLRLAAAKTDDQLAACLSDRSAAWIGFVHAGQINQDVAVLAGASAFVPHGVPKPYLRLRKEWKRFLHGYGTDMEMTLDHGALPRPIASHGGRFLSALEGFRRRLVPGAAGRMLPLVVSVREASRYQYTAVSPTRVRVGPPPPTPPSAASADSPMPFAAEVRQEGNRWYLNVGDWTSL